MKSIDQGGHKHWLDKRFPIHDAYHSTLKDYRVLWAVIIILSLSLLFGGILISESQREIDHLKKIIGETEVG